ncbi:MAG: FkbM family methyltransferase [Candidatus Hodarchaeales archaeon]|jgi:FkbM family methyltransferase
MNFSKFLSKFFIYATKFIPTGMPFIILKGPLKGFKLIMGAPAGSGKGVSILFNRSEPKRLKLTKDLILPNFICFDIGANIGMYSLLFSRYSKITYAFEPLPRNLKFLHRIIKLNKVENVKVFPYAVADKEGISWFQEGNSVAEGKLNSKGTLRVPKVSLDTFIEKNKIKPNLLKIDVEGAELLVLEGGKNYLSENKPLLLIETHGDKIKKKCFNFLQEIGYTHFKPIDSNSIEGANDFFIKS